MTTNPLAARRESALPSNSKMKPGESRTIYLEQIGRTVTIHRTRRDYAEDLCDAYNAQLPRKDAEWFVDSNGNVRLRDKDSWSRANAKQDAEAKERERREWMRCQRNPVHAYTEGNPA